MARYLDPRRNLIAQLSSFWSEVADPLPDPVNAEEENTVETQELYNRGLQQTLKQSLIYTREEQQAALISGLDISWVREQSTLSVQSQPPDGSFKEDLDTTGSLSKNSFTISSAICQYLQDNNGLQNTLASRLQEHRFSLTFDFDMCHVRIESDGSTSETPSLQIINDTIGEVTLNIERHQLYILPDIHVRDILKEGDMVMMFVEEECLKLIGPTAKVKGIAERLKNANYVVLQHRAGTDAMFSSYLADSKTLTLTQTCYQYVLKHQWDEVSKLKEDDPYLYIDGSEKDGKYCIIVEGSMKSVQSAVAIVKDIVGQLRTTRFWLQTRNCMCDGVPDNCLDIEERRGCIMKLIQNVTTTSTIKCFADRKKTTVRGALGEMQRIEADVIVNTTNKALNLQVGWGLSSALLKAAGKDIQKELKLKYPEGINFGEVAVSGPGILTNCKIIYHGALPPFDASSDKSYRMLILFMMNCLDSANSVGHTTIAFPALGTGIMQYPIQTVVQLMYRTVRKFLDSTIFLSLEEVIFVVYPSSNQLIKQAFIMENLSKHLKSVILDDIVALHQEVQTSEVCCEARLSVGKNVIQVFNCDVKSVCDMTRNVLVVWRRKNITAANIDNPFLIYIDPGINNTFNTEMALDYICRCLDNRRIQALNLKVGNHLGLAHLGVQIHWFGKRGMKWREQLPVVQIQLERRPPLSIILIHLGSNGLVDQTICNLIHCVTDDISYLGQLLPKTVFIWSEVLFGLHWYGAVKPKAVERCRLRFNRAGVEAVRDWGGRCIYHRIKASDLVLYQHDGVHLSDVGSALFVNTVQEALEQFLSDPEIAHKVYLAN